MDIKYYVSQYLNGDAPASSTEIGNEENLLNVRFPSGYLEIIKYGDELEGKIGETYFSFWPVTQLSKLNKEFKVDYYLSENIIVFATNGGGKAFAFDYRSTPPKIVLTSLGDLDIKELKLISKSIDDLFDFASKMPALDE